jgi:TusA-related sulfurtransferase
MMKIDVRGTTCQGGGALWNLLSHVRELPCGGTLELLTDDFLASRDIPEWLHHEGWDLVADEDHTGYRRFVIQKPSVAA